MPISCPHCGKKFDVADPNPCQSGCASCGRRIDIPPPASLRGFLVPFAQVLGLILCVLVLLNLVGSTMQQRRARPSCLNNLHQIARAFHQYHNVYGSFPPPYLADADGRPMHSWRVLLLPFLDQSRLYAAYRFDQAWDSTANRRVVEATVPVYICPSDSAAVGAATTSYMVITGPGTLFEGTKAASIYEILDAASMMLLVIEVHDTGVGWAEPADLDADSLELPFAGGRRSPGSPHSAGVLAAMCDGSVQFISDSISPEVFRWMITPQRRGSYPSAVNSPGTD